MISTEQPADFKPRFEVAGCFFELEGRILLLLRQDHKPQGNTWSLPAGKVDAGESPRAAMAREIREETGYTAEPSAYEPVATYYVEHDGYQFVYHNFAHSPAERPVVVLEPGAHKDYRWVTPEEALSLPLMPDEAPCIRAFYGISEP